MLARDREALPLIRFDREPGAGGRRGQRRRMGRDRAPGPRRRAPRARPRRGARRGRPPASRTSRPPWASIPSRSRTRSAHTFTPSSGRSSSPRGSPCPRTAIRSTTPRGAPARSSSTTAERLADTLAALSAEPQTGYELSLALFPGAHPPSQRRFAVAETLAHLERLVATGEAARQGDVTPVTYTER